MNKNKNEKFSFEKFEIAKLKKTNIIGGTGVGGDPDTGTKTSDNCSTKPWCKDNPNNPDPNNPFDPDPNNVFIAIQ